MDMRDILKLVNAGFTKAEIAAMAARDQAPPSGSQEPTQPPAQEPIQPPAQEPIQPPARGASLEEKFDALMDKLNQMNFLGASQPAGETVDDIIANIINPKTIFESEVK